MNYSVAVKTSCVSTIIVAGVAAQSGSIYVNQQKVNAALAKGGVVLSVPNVKVAGVHRDRAGVLETLDGTAILYVTDGAATLVAGSETRSVTKGDVVIVPAGMRQSFTAVPRAISYYLVTVAAPRGTPSSFVHVDSGKVAATLKKAGPLGDGPSLRVSGGYRTGPYAPADYRPDAEVHEKEADLFYVIDGSATLVTGGTVVDGRLTGPGQIRGSKVDGGVRHHLGKGDVMWVPAGVPHWFPEIPQPLSYLLVKVFSD